MAFLVPTFIGLGVCAGMAAGAAIIWHWPMKSDHGTTLDEATTWHPAHVQARVKAVFAGIEQARAEAQACHVHGLATEKGEAAIEKTLFKAGAMVPEPRALERVAIMCADDQPRTSLDTLHILVSGLELRCEEPFEELWKLVRHPQSNQWLLDEVVGGEAVAGALQRLTGESGVVGRA